MKSIMISSLFLNIMRASVNKVLTGLETRVIGALLAFVCSTPAAPNCAQDGEVQKAFQVMQAGEFQKAIEMLSRLEKSAPACDPDQYHLLAVAWLNLHENERGLNAVERGLSVFGASPELQEYYVSVLAFKCSQSDALARLEQVVARDPAALILREELARRMLDADPESARAGAMLKDLVQLLPQDVDALGNYAKWLSAMHRDAEAEGQLKTALQVAPGQPDVQVDLYRLLGVVEDRLNREDEADTAYREAVRWNARRSKPSYSAELEYAEFLMRRSRNNDAAQVLRKLLAAYPNLSMGYLDLARILARQNDYDESIEQALRALALASGARDQKPIRILLARTYHLAGRDAEARVQEEWVASH